jgi:uncharacterized protein
VDASLSASGRLFRLRLGLELAGPCWRCLEEARTRVAVDTREFAASRRQPGAPFDEDLDCAYLDGDRLDLAGWARDAVVAELPPAILCEPGCEGLCPSCGARRAAGPCGCAAPADGDPRWGPLADLAARLSRAR